MQNKIRLQLNHKYIDSNGEIVFIIRMNTTGPTTFYSDCNRYFPDGREYIYGGCDIIFEHNDTTEILYAK